MILPLESTVRLGIDPESPYVAAAAPVNEVKFAPEPLKEVAVTTPLALICVTASVSPVTFVIPEKVETPETVSVLDLNSAVDAAPAVTVTRPEDTFVTVNPSPKLIPMHCKN